MKTHAVPCPTCNAPIDADCLPIGIQPGFTHTARSDAYARTQPRPVHGRVTCYDTDPVEPELPENKGGGKQVTIG